MALFKGEKITVEVYGESHSEKIGIKVKGLPEITFDRDKLDAFLSRRKATDSAFSTPRKEADEPTFFTSDGDIITGGKILGGFTAEIKNLNVKSKDYSPLYGKPRPSHADYAWFLKDGALDFSGGGRFSGRLTAPVCVLGGILKQYLENKGVKIDAYLKSVGKAEGLSYKDDLKKVTDLLSKKTFAKGEFPTLKNADGMEREIADARKTGDSVGGVIECVISGFPCGVGDNLFDGLESKISPLLFAIPGVKGVEFGDGFNLSKMHGSEANDNLAFVKGKVEFLSDRSGGINGGISNGQPICFSVAMRPTPSISVEQQTVDLIKKETVKIKIEGRHDCCIAVRALPVVESMAAIALADALI